MDVHPCIGKTDVHPHIRRTDVHSHIGRTEVHSRTERTDVHPCIERTDVHPCIGRTDVHPCIGRTDVHPCIGRTDVHSRTGSTDVHPCIGMPPSNRNKLIRSRNENEDESQMLMGGRRVTKLHAGFWVHCYPGEIKVTGIGEPARGWWQAEGLTKKCKRQTDKLGGGGVQRIPCFVVVTYKTAQVCQNTELICQKGWILLYAN